MSTFTIPSRHNLQYFNMVIQITYKPNSLMDPWQKMETSFPSYPEMERNLKNCNFNPLFRHLSKKWRYNFEIHPSQHQYDSLDPPLTNLENTYVSFSMF